MPQINVESRTGARSTIQADPELTLMEALREHGFDELAAMCGGCCSCATCHVYISGQSVGELPPIGEDEDDLLSGSEHRRADSRLSCQLPLSGVSDALDVIIAPED